ncbi:hypothetical protein F2P81_022078 [Scophthalmus maximus]|uniref:SAP domain-containing protein n=1 Tax=Scophthalmus maximus TaxID=52904 RepID=A0A6A4RXJ7_SCOMX|nr:hypothetical protein F2P81_022078 [Scophthalmus maximus]
MSSLLVPSPQSEAVTHELEELTLQPIQNLPPLSERKNVLQLRLQQRRTREQLVDQGIMPPLKSPAAFHGQIRSLERARTENFLKHKIRSRPERAELVRMHILQETGAEPSLQATQMRLKRARLADNLNEKIAQRPGPMELVEKNILPVDSTVKEAIIVGQVNYPKVLDEDSCDALSPEQPASQASLSSAPSPAESKTPETPSPAPAPVPLFSTMLQQSQQKTPSEKSRSKKGKEPKSRVKKLKYHQYVPPDQKVEASEAPMDSSYARLLQQQQLFLQLQILSQQQQHYNYQTILPAPLKPVAEGQSSTAGGLPTSIVVSLPTAPPPPPLPSAPARPNNSLSNRRPGVLPANLEEMKVAELKLELKLRGLPVSGTKTDLIERLKPFQDNPSTSAPTIIPPPVTTTSMTMEVSTATTASTTPAIVLPVHQVASERMTSTPPVSPIPTDPSALQQDVGMSEAHSEPQMVSAGSAGPRSSPRSPFHIPQEKDRRLHEKERQIEELMRKLEQEQRLVEELKMQLEVEKRGQGGCSADSTSVSPKLTSLPTMNPVPTLLNSNAVKMEGTVLSNCSTAATISNPVPGSQALTSPLPTVVKLEDVTVSAGKPLQLQTQTQLITKIQPQVSTSPHLLHQSRRSPKLQTQTQAQPTAPSLQQFFISHPGRVSQVLGQSQTLLAASRQPQTLLVPTATSQQMDDLFDILIESGEMTPFMQQDTPVSHTKNHPVTANVSTLPVNTVLCRPPPQIHMAPPPTLSPALDPSLPTLCSLATDNQLEAFLEGTLAGTSPVSDLRTRGLMEELHAQLMEQQPYSPMDTSDLSFCDSSSPPSSLNMGLSDPTLDNMEWLDLTMPPGPAGALTPLGIPTDFLDSQDLQLHWD